MNITFHLIKCFVLIVGISIENQIKMFLNIYCDINTARGIEEKERVEQWRKELENKITENGVINWIESVAKRYTKGHPTSYYNAIDRSDIYVEIRIAPLCYVKELIVRNIYTYKRNRYKEEEKYYLNEEIRQIRQDI